MHQNTFGGRAPPGPARGSLSRSPSRNQGILLLRGGREGKGREGKGERGGEGNGRKEKGGEGNEKKGGEREEGEEREGREGREEMWPLTFSHGSASGIHSTNNTWFAPRCISNYRWQNAVAFIVHVVVYAACM